MNWSFQGAHRFAFALPVMGQKGESRLSEQKREEAASQEVGTSRGQTASPGDPSLGKIKVYLCSREL